MNQSKITPKRPKGFPDYLPNLQDLRSKIQNIVRKQAHLSHFQEISTSALEYQEILIDKVNKDDLDDNSQAEVMKQIFKFTDNGGREVALRFDLTVPFSRFCAEHFNDLSFPFKKLQIGPVWRAENPQKGRYREFMQCDLDIIGADTITADTEVIFTLFKILTKVIPTNFSVKIGDRNELNSLMVQYLNIDQEKDQQKILIQLDKLDKIGIDGVQKSLLKIFPEKESQIIDFLNYLQNNRYKDPENNQRMKSTLNLLQNLKNSKEEYKKHNISFDLFLARGLAYYTGIVFEVIVDEKKEFGSICSGGRYNNLFEKFFHQELPGVGGSIGLDRLIAVLEDLELDEATYKKIPHILICPLSIEEKYLDYCFNLLEKFRDKNIITTIFSKDQKIKNQFKYAEKIQASFVVIIGEDEIKNKTLTLKNLKNFEQTNNITFEQAIELL